MSQRIDKSVTAKLNRTELSNRIDTDLSDWMELDREKKAVAVPIWCHRNCVSNGLSAEMLEAAMAQMLYWSQGPAQYLDMVFALDAAVREM